MELKEVEMRLEVQFPNLFHLICETEMGEYLVHSKERFRDTFAQEGNSFLEYCFFGKCYGDCELILFEDIKSNYIELYEGLKEDLAYNPQYKSINPNYKLIPFAHMASGDVFCFLYGCQEAEPKIVVYGHDTGDIDVWANNFEEFIYIQLVAYMKDGESELHSEHIKRHIQWLSDEHKALFEKMPIATLFERIPWPQPFTIWI